MGVDGIALDAVRAGAAFANLSEEKAYRVVQRLVRAGALEAAATAGGEWGYRIVGYAPAVTASSPAGKSKKAIPRRVREAVFARDGSVCATCGATEDLTLDHVWPESRGGGATVENLRVLCRSCNSRKGARM